MRKFFAFSAILIFVFLSCKHTISSDNLALEGLCNTIAVTDSNNNVWYPKRKVGAGGFGQVYSLERSVESPSSVADYSFGLSQGSVINDQPEKVLKISNDWSPEVLETFVIDEDLMASLPDIGLPFSSSEKVGIKWPVNNLNNREIPAYIKPYHKFQIQDLESYIEVGEMAKNLGKNIGEKFLEIAKVQSGQQRISGLLISDIGLFHSNNLMFDRAGDGTFEAVFIDMLDFHKNLNLKVNDASKVHDKNFLTEWTFMESVNSVVSGTMKFASKKKRGGILSGILAVFGRAAVDNPNLIGMIKQILDANRSREMTQEFFYLWKYSQLDRLMRTGLGHKIQDIDLYFRTGHFIKYAPTEKSKDIMASLVLTPEELAVWHGVSVETVKPSKRKRATPALPSKQQKIDP